MNQLLTKSKYTAGIQCQKRLWLEIHSPDKASSNTTGKKHRMEVGEQVEIFARGYFPSGLLIQGDNLDTKLNQTKQVMDNGTNVIFGGVFLFNDICVIADILEKADSGSWNIIQVKSAAQVKEEYYPDLTIQKYVLQKIGLSVCSTKIMYLNRDCIHPELSNLFILQDITEQIEDRLGDLEQELSIFRNIFKQQSVPEINIGSHCDSPYPCPFKEYCWKDVTEFSIFLIPRLSKNKKKELLMQKIFNLQDLPDTYPLNSTQKAFVQRILKKDITIDKDGIKQKLAQLQYPLYFLDFETDNPAIPRFNGFRPYQPFPFQYSCHVMQENGEVVHFEYLHTESTDPMLPLLQSLLNHIHEKGSVIVYNAGTEKGILKRLSENFPEYKQPIDSIIERIWDQLDLIRNHYQDYRFSNSNSLKQVLPVLVPELSYQQLTIQHGDEAQYAWNQLLSRQDEKEKQQIIANLKSYCKMDTNAMVEIQKKLCAFLSM